MKEKIESELKLIYESKTSIQVKAVKYTKNECRLEIKIPSSLTKLAEDIKMSLIAQKNFPIIPPKLLFITNFTFPHISDYRDVLEDILQKTWTNQIHLLELIEKIPKFIIEYINLIKSGFLILSGSYYLDETYDIPFLESLPVYTKRVKEIEIINNKQIETLKILMISDVYFCLFEIDKKNKSSCTLTFWSNIRALITIRRIVKENLCKFIWRNKQENRPLYEIQLIIQNGEELVNTVLAKMNSFGINYNISQRNLEAKQGKIPNCDIEMVEKQIDEIERKIKNSNETNLEMVQFLMMLYEKAIEYYSAINNPRFEHFTKKIQECLKTSSMVDFMEKSVQQSKKEEQLIPATKEEEEKKQLDDVKNQNVKEEKKENPNNINDIKSLSLNEISKKESHNEQEQHKSSRSLHVAISNEDDDNMAIDVSSDDEEDEDEEEEKEEN